MTAYLGPCTALMLFAIRCAEMVIRRRGVRGKVVAPWTLAGMIASGFCVLAAGCIERFRLGEAVPAWLYTIGLIAAGASFWIRAEAARALGRFWSMQVELRVGQPLLTTGIYGVIRHPIYSAGILEVIAIAALCGSPWALIVALPTFVPAMVARIRIEERELARHFGVSYADYGRRVPALVPWPTAGVFRKAE
jgi:protein-S-isoprenylcysteine O-methyltransferase Ste14